MKKYFDILKKYKHKLTRQQLLTFKGQILKQDFTGFIKGITKVLNIDIKV